jgi:hypothetical protein
MADRVRYPNAVVERVRELAQNLPDTEIAAQLNREGRISAKGKPYTKAMIRWIRWCHHVPPATFKQAEELTVQEVAKRFGVSIEVVYGWIRRRFITARQLSGGKPYWITLNAEDEQRLCDWVRSSTRIHRASQT